MILRHFFDTVTIIEVITQASICNDTCLLQHYMIEYLRDPPSFTIVTVVRSILPSVTFVGSESLTIVRLKVSLVSKTVSLMTVTLNDTLIIPAGNVIMYSTEL